MLTTVADPVRKLRVALVDGNDVEEPLLAHPLRTVFLGLRERRLASEHLIIDAADEVDVAALVVLVDAGGLLQRRVVLGAGIGHFFLLSVAAFVDRGHAEVDDFGLQGARHQHVVQLQVAVRQAVFQGVGQAIDDVGRQPRGLERIELLADFDQIAEVPALDKLHHQVVQIAVRIDFVDGHDVRMPQGDAQLALADELCGLFGLVAVAAAQDLQGNDFARLAMYRAEDARESAGADGIEHLVRAVEIA